MTSHALVRFDVDDLNLTSEGDAAILQAAFDGLGSLMRQEFRDPEGHEGASPTPAAKAIRDGIAQTVAKIEARHWAEILESEPAFREGLAHWRLQRGITSVTLITAALSFPAEFLEAIRPSFAAVDLELAAMPEGQDPSETVSAAQAFFIPGSDGFKLIELSGSSLGYMLRERLNAGIPALGAVKAVGGPLAQGVFIRGQPGLDEVKVNLRDPSS